MQSNESDSPTPAKAEEHGRLVDAASRDGTADDYGGKRLDTRFAAGMLLDLSTDPEDPSASWSGQMHNISDEGIGFWSKRQLVCRSNVYIREFAHQGSNPWLLARVAHCAFGIRGYLIGARFDQEAGQESLDQPRPTAEQP